MIEERFKTIYILVIIGLSMIFTGLILKFIEATKEAYCNSLEFREYYENKDCRRFMR